MATHALLAAAIHNGLGTKFSRDGSAITSGVSKEDAEVPPLHPCQRANGLVDPENKLEPDP